MTSNMRLMKASEIPAFVDKVIGAGCDICAIGHFGYFLGSGEEMVAAEDGPQAPSRSDLSLTVTSAAADCLGLGEA